MKITMEMAEGNPAPVVLWGRVVIGVLVWVLLVQCGGAGSPSGADKSHPPAAERKLKSDEIAVVQLPREAVETLKLIKAGGPFPYSKDGSIFGNRERRLPLKQRGHYREYTVKTPGVRHRGARRIVAGGEQEYYYTADHYETFKRIVE